MRVDVEDLGAAERFPLLSGLVVPRPIAWITTAAPGGSVNLAPFSFFNAVCADPPLLMVAIDDREGGGDKDTLANLRSTGECVVHVVDEATVDAAAWSGIDAPPGVSEADALGLELVASGRVAVPRVAAAAAAMECRLERHERVGRATTLALLAVLRFVVRDELVEGRRVIAERLRAVGRVGGPRFVVAADPFERRVPGYSEWRGGDAAPSDASPEGARSIGSSRADRNSST